jgi:hypothetical protein
MKKILDILMDIVLILILILVSSNYIESLPRYTVKPSVHQMEASGNMEKSDPHKVGSKVASANQGIY